MPLTIPASSPETKVANLRKRRFRRGAIGDGGRRIRIGLVNNMPDAAFATTERQFTRLIEEASGDLDVQLRLFFLETLPREASTSREMAKTYLPARELPFEAPDALIVTGAEPRAPDLRDEPYWSELAGLIDWSETHTVSTLFSCLAGHAAVLHRDGVARRPLPKKLSGVFSEDVVARHELVEGVGERIATPHSRYNGLDGNDLTDRGYTVLTRSRETGVDIFVKDGTCLRVFLQGHPEYDCDTLAREYRRDALRFVRGETAQRPAQPAHYFPAPLARRLNEWIERALVDPSSPFPIEALRPGAAHWAVNSVRLFRNWIATVARRKSALISPTFATARWGG